MPTISICKCAKPVAIDKAITSMPFVSTVRAVRKSNSEPFSWKSVTSHNCVQVPLSVRARHRSQKQRHMKNRKRQNTNENVCVYITVWNVDRNHGTTNNKKISLGHNTILDFFLSVMCVSAFASSWNHKLRLLTTTRHALNNIEYAIRIAVNEQRSITAKKKQFFFLVSLQIYRAIKSYLYYRPR